MKYKYLRLPANSQLTATGKPWTFVPLVDVELKAGNKSPFRCKALIDSGAGTCLFHGSVGEALGIEVESGKKAPMKGVTSQSGWVYYHKIVIGLDGHNIESIVGFSYDLDLYFGLLGQVGFFDSFRVCFDLPKQDFEVVPKFPN